jgi:hypothetical protein
VVDYSPDLVLLQATAGIAVRDNMATAVQSSARRCRSKRHGEWPLAVGLVAEVEVLVWWSIRNMASVNIVECMLRFWSMSRPANRQLGCKIELNGTLAASVDVEQLIGQINGTLHNMRYIHTLGAAGSGYEDRPACSKYWSASPPRKPGRTATSCGAVARRKCW